jgi:homoserine acetyltransferase
MLITRVSMRTGKVHTLDIDVTPQQIKRWESGEYIQHVMPHLSTADRVFIITGSTREEWDKAFKEKYEEDAEPDIEDQEAAMYEAQTAKQIEQPEGPKPEEYWNSHEADADSVAKQQDSHASDEPYNTEGRGL